jgi:hypothetical protein
MTIRLLALRWAVRQHHRHAVRRNCADGRVAVLCGTTAARERRGILAKVMTGGTRWVGVWMAVLVAAVPAVSLACELACARPTGDAGHHGDSNQHATTAHHHQATPDSAVATVTLTSFGAGCADHAAVAAVVTNAPAKVLAPVVTQAPDAFGGAPTSPPSMAVDRRSGGPPGARSAPLALRI